MPFDFDPNYHHRRSIRLPGYDYRQPGAYFVTVCVHRQRVLFGEVEDGAMHPNRLGEVVQRAWLDLPHHYPQVRLDAFCLMPDHMHGIIVIVAGGGEPVLDMNKNHGLPEIVRAFKSFSARRINAIRRTPGTPVWQRNYYEHIIRNPAEHEKIRAYILTNPQRWKSTHT